MSEQIIRILDYTCEKLGIAIDWTQENVLPYVQELCGKYIQYEIVTSIVWCFLFLSLTMVFLIIANKFHKKAQAPDVQYDSDEAISWIAVIAWVCVAISGIVTVIVTFVQAFDIVTCLTLPEKMILEFANKLLK